jgi:ABC-type antimicrobial peptide transport system permease subunit
VLALIVANVRRRMARTSLTAAGIAVGVAAVAALLALSAGLDATAAQLVHLGKADLGMFQADASDPTASLLPLSLLPRVRNEPFVSAATPIQLVTGAVARDQSAFVFGLDPKGFVAGRLVFSAGSGLHAGAADIGDVLLLLSAVGRAVAETPELNGFWLNGGFRPADAVHLGVAVSLRGGGLIAPALHDANRKSLDEIMAGVRDLVNRARSGRLRSSEMSDPTITVTNFGERGVDLVHGVIYPPQVALVGFGGVRERPWAAGGMLGVRPVVTATLAADHRASDGHTGSRLLALIDKRLQKPEEL